MRSTRWTLVVGGALALLGGGCGAPSLVDGTPGTGVSACGTAPLERRDCSRPQVVRPNDPMVQIALDVPGFGGFFSHALAPEPGEQRAPAPYEYTAYLTDLAQEAHAREYLASWFAVDPALIGVVQGRYDMLDLARWQCIALDVTAGLPVVASDLSAQRNRITFALSSGAALSCAVERLRAAELPTEAFVLEAQDPGASL